MPSRANRILSILPHLFHESANKITQDKRVRKALRATGVLTVGSALMAGSLFGADRLYHAEWGYPNAPENTSGFTFWYRLADESEATALGGVAADYYAYDFWGSDEKRFYAAVSADFSDGTSSRSPELPVLMLDGNLLLTIPSGSTTITLPSGQRLDAMMDTNFTYVNGLVTTPPTGYQTYDNGTNRYYGNHLEQLFINNFRTKLLIYPTDDFTGETVGKPTSLYYGDQVYITGYARHLSATQATAPDSLGVQKPIYAVVIVEKPDLKNICRVNYTAITASDYQLQRISPRATDYTTVMDATDLEMTKHNLYLDPNGDQWYGSVNAAGRKMRIRKWTAANVEQPSVDIDFDKLVVSGKSLTAIPATQKIFKYVRQIDGTHFMLATVDGGAIVTYELDTTGNLILTTDGLSVKKIVQGPFAEGAAQLVDAVPSTGSTGFNVVWSYPSGTSTVPAGTYSIWKANQYTRYSSYFRIYPDDYAVAQLYNPQNEGPYYSKMRIWPVAKKREYYAWGAKPKPQSANNNKKMFIAASATPHQRIVPLSQAWNFGEVLVAGVQAERPDRRTPFQSVLAQPNN
ncbi:MAG: hypothetical protein EOM37_01310 [Proteobacteria bacterium]|jgi:hypothetical protein|nr:hypothetical protein [Alphaproteobacteria bacterium]NCC02677.1 hypothetical protein [Pseudomonadota bacterium]